MNLQTKTQNNSLVNIQDGTRLPLVEPGAVRFIDVDAGDQALLIEKVGTHPDGKECWHALVDGHLILLWSDAFSGREA